MTFSCSIGEAFLLPSGPREEYHLHVVMTNECADGSVMLLSVTTLRSDKNDRACLCGEGDHEFLDHPSYVAYNLVTKMPKRHIMNMIAKKLYKEKASVSREFYDKIVDGIYESDRIKGWAEDYFEENT